MNKKDHRSGLEMMKQGMCGGCCNSSQEEARSGFSRRQLLQGAGLTLGGLALSAARIDAGTSEPVPAEEPFPHGTALTVQPILVFDVPARQERTSWRSYGGITMEGFDTDDVVVDSCEELLWRLRAMYGLKNAKGTKMLTIGGLCAYSMEAQENGPRVAADVWDYEFVDITDQQFTNRLNAARTDAQIVKQVEDQTTSLLNMPNVTLQTDRKFVFNSYLALHVIRQYLQETGATNFGFARCMGPEQIAMLDTPACLVLSLANDAGYTAYCHTDLSHTMPGVLLRWIASRPTFVCNSHYPYDGIFFVAHCQAPRRMNGRDYEPATIMTHYESDYGAACKTHYPKGQEVTVLIPNLRCTQWQGFRGKIVGSPSYPACRSQMEIAIDGDWQRLLREMQGFHTQIVYGDYTREVGYALKKLGGKITWRNYSHVRS